MSLSDEIKERVDIVEEIQRHGVELKRVGKVFKGLCPFHVETTPSFIVDPGKRLFHCHGCDAGGSVIDFVMMYLKKDFAEASQILGQRAGINGHTRNGNGAAAKPSAMTLEELAAQYGLRASDFIESGCSITKDGRAVAYPMTSLDGSRFLKFKSMARENGKRKTWMEAGHDGPAYFGSLEGLEGSVLAYCGGEDKRLAAVAAGFIAISPKDGEKPPGPEMVAAIKAAKPARVVVCFDADDTGRKAAADAVKAFCDAGLDGRMIEWGTGRKKGYDLNDLLIEEGLEAVEYAIRNAKGHVPEGLRKYNVQIVNAADLMKKTFPPLNWLVFEIIPPGLCILTADPKAGKSRIATSLSLCVAAGLPFWGFPTRKGRVLYLAMEEGEELLYDRITDFHDGAPGLENINFINWSFPTMGDGFIEALEYLIHDDPPALIIVDTWGRVKGATRGKSDAYTEDVQVLAPLHRWAHKYNNTTVLMLHHNRKMAGTNAMHKASGSMGLVGTVDEVYTLEREAGGAVFQFGGKRVRNRKFNLAWTHGQWALAGEVELDSDPISKERAEIIEIIRNNGGQLAPSEVAHRLGKNQNTIRGLMAKMAKKGSLIHHPQLGQYSIPTAKVLNTENVGTNVNGGNAVNAVNGDLF